MPPASLTCFEVCQSGRTRVTSRDVTARSPAPRFLPPPPSPARLVAPNFVPFFHRVSGLVMAVRDLFSLQAWPSLRGSDVLQLPGCVVLFILPQRKRDGLRRRGKLLPHSILCKGIGTPQPFSITCINPFTLIEKDGGYQTHCVRGGCHQSSCQNLQRSPLFAFLCAPIHQNWHSKNLKIMALLTD